jgi:hypothetical protein
LSTQSTATTLDDTAIVDATMDEGDTVLTTATDVAQSSTTKAKKGGRTKKSKSKSKAAAAATTDSAPASSMIEPEDDDYEIKVGVPPPKPTRARKRKSDEIEAEDEETEAPAPKRRGARTRNSTIQPEATTEVVSPSFEDTTMADVEAEPSKPVPKKKGKQSTRSRVTSTKRKASAPSTAPQASLRNIEPADEEIEAALEADLNRPLTDDEIVPPTKPAPSRAASRSQTKKAAASVAPVRQEARESTNSTSTMQTANEELSTMLNADETFASIPPIKNPKQRATRKGKVQQKASASMLDNTMPDAAGELDQTSAEPPAEEAPARGKGRQPSRKASRQVSRQVSRQKAKKAEPEVPLEIANPAQEAVSAEVTIIHAPAEDDDDSQKKGKAVKRAVSTTKKGRKGKASTMKEEVVEDNVKAVIEQKVPKEPAPEVVDEPEPEQPKPKATRGRPKKNLTKEPEPEPKPVNKPVTKAVKAAPEPQKASSEPQAPSATPVKKSAPAATQQIPSPTPSPQSSDAENHPPSSRPSATRPPLVVPTSPVATRVPLAASTPTAARSNLNASKLSTTFPWTAVDLDYALAGTPGAAGQENLDLSQKFIKADLTSPEKKMTVEQWIRHQAALGRDRLKGECESVVQRFENESVRALKALEGIVAEE